MATRNLLLLKNVFQFLQCPRTFQRFMNIFHKGLPDVNILIYLDDTTVLSLTFKEYPCDLERVFERLEKCKFLANQEISTSHVLK